MFLAAAGVVSVAVAQTPISGVINTYGAVEDIAYPNKAFVPGGSFASGDKVLLIQMQGATIDLTQTSTFGSVTDLGKAGTMEFATIASVEGNWVTFANDLECQYDIFGAVQMVSVPQYEFVTVTGELTCEPWNGKTGGVLVFQATGTVSLQADINVSEKGFRGAVTREDLVSDCNFTSHDFYYDTNEDEGAAKGEGISLLADEYKRGKGAAANGGGGGNNHNAGGGGGSSYGMAGKGGCEFNRCEIMATATQGIGGYALQNLKGACCGLPRAYMGGGGGAGHTNNSAGTSGANGGGIVIICAQGIVAGVHGILSRGGNVPDNTLLGQDGCGGGGGGGTVLLDLETYPGEVPVDVSGGNGGNSIFNERIGPGGGGGGGVVQISGNVLSTNITATVAGGVGGTHIVQGLALDEDWGAEPGTPGIYIAGLLLKAGDAALKVNAGADTEVSCNDPVVRLNATITEGQGLGPFRYRWTPETGLDNPYKANPVASPKVTTEYIVEVVDENGCAMAIDTVLVTVSKTGNPEIRKQTMYLCGIDSLLLDAGGGAARYEWSTGETTRSITVKMPGVYAVEQYTQDECLTRIDSFFVEATEPTGERPVIVPGGPLVLCEGDNIELSVTEQFSQYVWSTGDNGRFARVSHAGSYWVAVKDSAGCWVSSDTVEVTIETVEVFLLADVRICPGGEAVLDAGQGYAEYRWSTGETTQSITVTETGDYTVEVKTENGCTAVSNVSTVSVGNELSTDIRTENLELCEGDSTVLDAGAGLERYRWNTGETTRRITVTEAGEYYVEIESGGCSGTSDPVVIVVRPVSKPVITVVGEPAICRGDSVTLDAGEGYDNYEWNTGATTRTIIVKESGSYFVSVQRADECEGASSPVDISVTDPPTVAIELSGPTEFCAGGRVTLTAITSSGGNVIWSDGSEEETITVTESGMYSVRVIDPLGCESESEEIAVTVSPLPMAEAGEGGMICRGDSLQLSAAASTVQGALYQWTPSRGLSCTDCLNPMASPETTTTYTLTVTTADGCLVRDDVTVEIDESVGIVRAAIPRDINVKRPGDRVTIPVLVEWPEGLAVNEAIVEVQYDQRMMILTGLDLTGTQGEGWSVDVIEQVPGTIAFRLHGARRVPGSGALVNLRFATHLSMQLMSELPLRFELPGTGCVAVEATPGFIRLDSICGLSFRLIEATGLKYSLANTPNPFNPATQIQFTLGFDGPTNLVVYDVNGQLVEQLVNEHLEAGAYSFTWDASGYSSGLYYCRMTSGHWSAVREMVVVK